jgi:hypothetical protein
MRARSFKESIRAAAPISRAPSSSAGRCAQARSSANGQHLIDAARAQAQHQQPVKARAPPPPTGGKPAASAASSRSHRSPGAAAAPRMRSLPVELESVRAARCGVASSSKPLASSTPRVVELEAHARGAGPGLVQTRERGLTRPDSDARSTDCEIGAERRTHRIADPSASRATHRVLQRCATLRLKSDAAIGQAAQRRRFARRRADRHRRAALQKPAAYNS